MRCSSVGDFDPLPPRAFPAFPRCLAGHHGVFQQAVSLPDEKLRWNAEYLQSLASITSKEVPVPESFACIAEILQDAQETEHQQLEKWVQRVVLNPMFFA
jgi:hypothetical protein